MYTKHALRFMKAVKVIKKNGSELKSSYKETESGALFSVISCVGLFAGLGMGGAIGLFQSGVALGNGKTEIDHTGLPAHVLLQTMNGCILGGVAGISLGLIAAAPRFVAATAGAVGVVAAATAIKNKM
jgi:hypothetical protein